MASDTKELQLPGTRSLVGWTELLRALVLKELKVKYKRSLLGFFWSLVTPIALTGVYLFVFIYVYKVPQKDFILFLLSGLLPWNFFNMSLLSATNSIVENGPIIRKLYFPRLLVPLSAVFANLITLLFAMGLFSVVLMLTGRPLWTHLHLLVLAIVLETLLVSGLALSLSVWNVYLRDIQQLISIVITVVFFATPVVYDLSRVPSRFKPFILANPMAAILELFRAALFTGRMPSASVVLLGIGEIVGLMALGLIVFQRLGPHLAKEV
jgi:lipopolysaccharide transport system permease protein